MKATIELKVLNDLYKQDKVKDKKGSFRMEKKIFKRGVISKVWLHKVDCNVAEYLSEKGTIVKSKCLVRDKSDNITYLVKGRAEDINKQLDEENNITVKGYIRYD